MKTVQRRGQSWCENCLGVPVKDVSEEEAIVVTDASNILKSLMELMC